MYSGIVCSHKNVDYESLIKKGYFYVRYYINKKIYTVWSQLYRVNMDENSLMVPKKLNTELP